MTPVYCNTHILLSGQAAGYTGLFVATSIGRDFSIISYGSGVDSTSALILSAPSPFFNGTVFPFLTIPITGNGYNNVYFLTSPIAEVQASLSGNGNIWAALVIRD